MSDRCAQQMDDQIEGGIQQMNRYEQEISDLKAHAVEVLAEYMTTIYKKTYGEKGYMESCRLEARALLGWDNDNNDKEE